MFRSAESADNASMKAFPSFRRSGTVIYLLFLSLQAFAAEPVDLRFHHREGQVLHAESLVDESVYINGFLSHQALIDEYSVVTVLEAADQGSAVLEGDFRSVERVSGLPGVLEWTETETVRMKREALGFLSVPEEAVLPVQRSIPRFPGYPVLPGDSWSLEASELHMFRIRGAMYGPYRGDVQVRYTLDRRETTPEGTELAVILISYDLYLPVRTAGEPVRLISGRSEQELYWDISNGRPLEKKEDFEFLMVMSDGVTQEFIGSGITRYRETRQLDRNAEAGRLQEDLQDMPGVVVEPSVRGVVLTLAEADRIYFDPDSADISAKQNLALESLGVILSRYGDRDILITGHTADYGTARGRRELSLKRAGAVAGALFPEGREGPGRLFLRGAGSTEPAGVDKDNRRVEILILD